MSLGEIVQKKPEIDVLEKIYREHQRRLSEISDEEKELRNEKQILLGENPWFKKSSSWIGIMAVIVPVALFSFNIFITQQNKELSVSYTQAIPLTFLTSSVKGKAQLYYNGEHIENIYRSTVNIKNTGTRAIQKSDFQDGPIAFQVSTAVTASGAGKPPIPLILDVVQKLTAGQKQAELNILSTQNPGTVTYLPSLLNPGDSVELEIYASTFSEYKVSMQGKIVDGELVFIDALEKLNQPGQRFYGFRIISMGILAMFGSTWAAIAVLVVSSSLLVLMCLGLAAFAVDEEWSLPNIVIMVTGVSVTILFISQIFFVYYA